MNPSSEYYLLQHIPVWLMEAKRHIEPHKAVFLLVGCKRDLAVNGHREVSIEEAQVTVGLLHNSRVTVCVCVALLQTCNRSRITLV